MKKFEGLRSKMKGKDIDDVIKLIEEKPAIYKLGKGVDYSMVELVKIAIDEGAKSDDRHYLIKTIDKENIDILNLLLENNIGVHGFIVSIKVKKSTYEFVKFLKKIEFDIDYKKYENLKPSFFDSTSTFLIHSFIKLHKEHLSKKHNVSEYGITDDMWYNNINKLILPYLEVILNRNGLSTIKHDPLSYGGGNLKVSLDAPEITEKDKKIMDILKDGVDSVDSLYKVIIDNL